MAEAVIDASAVMAVLRGEAGAGEAESYLPVAAMSAVNVAEVVARLIDFGAAPDVALRALDGLQVSILPFDAATALEAGVLRQSTRARGLSLGDRACIATAKLLGTLVVTADRAWAELDLGVEVVLIR
jgi:ribonuclease VapC